MLRVSHISVSQFDALSKTGVAWEPCAEHLWCGKYGTIWPSSIINKMHNHIMYRGGSEIGLVLAPPPLNQFYCIYPGDGNSMGHIGRAETPHGCQKACEGSRWWDCSYPPERLEQALWANSPSGKYNEVVIDAQHMKKHLPRSILGFFYSDPSTRAKAAEVHRAFVAKYGLKEFPLLHFSQSEGFSAVL